MVKHAVALLSLSLLLCCGLRVCAAGDEKAEKKEETKKARVPTKWFVGVRGHERALQAQEDTGADMVVFFFRDTPKGEKGLHRWFRKDTLDSWPVTRYLRDYVKVQVLLHPNIRQTKDLEKEYYVKKTPRFVVRRPNGFKKRVDVFDWPGGKPRTMKPAEFIERIRAVSSARYREEPEE